MVGQSEKNLIWLPKRWKAPLNVVSDDFLPPVLGKLTEVYTEVLVTCTAEN